MIEAGILLLMVDECLKGLGSAGLVDARKIRDMLLDLRLMCTKSIEIPDNIETITPMIGVV